MHIHLLPKLLSPWSQLFLGAVLRQSSRISDVNLPNVENSPIRGSQHSDTGVTPPLYSARACHSTARPSQRFSLQTQHTSFPTSGQKLPSISISPNTISITTIASTPAASASATDTPPSSYSRSHPASPVSASPAA